MSKFIVSLDFEMFWGVADSRSLASYRENIEGVWIAIPEILKLFREYKIHATWATVGMLMCRNYAQWCEIQPSTLPGYTRTGCSTYTLGHIAREHPKLFFGRPLLYEILDTPNQEVATHTYSHFYCGEDGATPEQFTADLECANFIAENCGVKFNSIVFPRNQVLAEYVNVLPKSGIGVYRGNPDHALYRDGHFVRSGFFGRVFRFADGWLPLLGVDVAKIEKNESTGLVNASASFFLRPYSKKLEAFEALRLMRMKNAMSRAAMSGGSFHLWWHPHNFGVNIEKNLMVLESLLQHFVKMQESYGMRSTCMGELFSPVQ